MDLNEIALFIEVVQLGSFSKAAQALNMPNSTVSSKISNLEKTLGLTLIQRTTRKLHITAQGQAFFKQCLEGLQLIRAAQSELTIHQEEPQGLLRITAPVELGSHFLPKIIPEFTRKFPKVNVEILLSDHQVDLVSEGVDLAIRVGNLKDSSLIAKKMGVVCFAPFASPLYLKKHPPISHPKDLKPQSCISFSNIGSNEWKLTHHKTSIKIALHGRILINDLNMVKNLTVSGQGIALLPTFFCREEVKKGTLKRVLPDWHSELTPVHLVYPAQKFIAPKLSAFLSQLKTITFEA